MSSPAGLPQVTVAPSHPRYAAQMQANGLFWAQWHDLEEQTARSNGESTQGEKHLRYLMNGETGFDGEHTIGIMTTKALRQLKSN